jgi:sigma-B regulation protein RsbU (phosphoserine phosphatase)
MLGESADGEVPRINCQAARDLATALGEMLGELQQTQNSLWEREAELAAGVPLIASGDEEIHLAARLEAVLQGGADAVEAQAAALYLLDEGTSELKLRSCWGLSRDRLIKPARPLQGALADLEAMLGHAVVLENTKMMEHWRAPEKFASGVCIPVSSPTTILGTIWIFCEKPRDFTDSQTNMVEVVAGRIAADLEREMLLHEGIGGVQIKRQVEAAGRMQRSGLPSISPLLDGWQTAGWTDQAGTLGGDFFDWFSLPEGRMAVSVGDSLNEGMESALSATVVRTAVRSHAQYQRDAARLLSNVNLTLWTGSAGDQSANLCCGLVDTTKGLVRFASAGQVSVLLLSTDGWTSFSQPSTPLGTSPESTYHQQEYELQPGESLVMFTNGFRDAVDEKGRPLGEEGLGDSLAGNCAGMSAEEIVDFARDRLEAHAIRPERSDRTVMVIKRTQA